MTRLPFHPELTNVGTRHHRRFRRSGLLDVVAALEWVQSEIAAFGGDPGCVTLWGESEGAVEALLLLGSPYCVSRNLFHRVKSDSGSQITFHISPREADRRARLLCDELKVRGRRMRGTVPLS